MLQSHQKSDCLQMVSLLSLTSRLNSPSMFILLTLYGNRGLYDSCACTSKIHVAEVFFLPQDSTCITLSCFTANAMASSTTGKDNETKSDQNQGMSHNADETLHAYNIVMGLNSQL